MEANTDMLGAIIMGNPREYALASQRSVELNCPNVLEKAESLKKGWFDRWKKEKQKDRTEYMQELASYNHRFYQPVVSSLRRSFRWAEILENAGVTDQQGNITDYKMALEMYSRASEYFSSLGKFESSLAQQRFRESER